MAGKGGGAMSPRAAGTLIAVVWLAACFVALMVIFVGEGKPKKDNKVEEVEVGVKYTALDEYVKKYDPNYSYKVLHDYTVRNDISTSFVINMTSQKWMTENVTSQHIWWHYMIITIPDKIKYENVGFLYVTGGSNRNSPPDPSTDGEGRLVQFAAEQVGCVGAMMRQNPNQPIVFANDPKQKSRSEDDIIAYTFRQYVDGPYADDPEIVLQMPMTKATVRALDTISTFANSRINRFYVAGASKRGWATWLTGVVDDRVVGIMPMVLTLLNMNPNFKHHYRSLTGWSFAIAPYWREDCMQYLDNPEARKLLEIVDPYEYRERLTKPKYIISASGDEFFLPDDHHYFYKAMLGPTFLRIHPNAEHSLAGHWRRMAKECVTFILWNEEGWEWPTITWTRGQNANTGRITVTVDREPTSITAYSADTSQDERRDFRLAIAKEINSTEIVLQRIVYRDIGVGQPEPNVYQAVIKLPKSGWNCFFIEMFFEGPDGHQIAMTTEVNIVPNTFPVEECFNEECISRLV
ncbi:Autocrine proliferation repressor protein A [Holothuria leucospilota]|uniref:Autocrine proliferation repressor protein A n=1 Tax=Holothuria leucospilota TaxID=206669 RepID=A0A9Q1C332_HOLLE|nr:Autocrine proliferation repressor protein A [Holothuria leucospilota]